MVTGAFPRRFAPFVYLAWIALAVAFAVAGLWEVDLLIAGWIAFWIAVKAMRQRLT
jgi:hypothetical protein